MKQRLGWPALAVVSAAMGAGLVTVIRPSSNDAAMGACRAGTAPMMRLELLFGMARPGGAPITEQEWTAFVDAEITPRFPDGLTVLTGNGQWTDPAGRLTREPSRVLLVWYKPDRYSHYRIEAVRSAFKERFQQQSVMRVDSRSCVGF